jgi:hypothetical protein
VVGIVIRKKSMCKKMPVILVIKGGGHTCFAYLKKGTEEEERH